MAGVVIPIQTTDAGKAQVKTQLDNLGSQMSQLVQSYNDQRTQVEAENKPELRAKMHELFEQRRAAIRQLVESFQAAKHSAEAQGITTAANPQLAGLKGDDLGGLQTAVATEQSKLAALATYYEQAKTAIAAGQPLPPTPPELQSGTFMGISTGTVALVLALGAAAYFLWFNKD